MSYHGDIKLGDTIDIKFTTRRFTTGAPFALASGVISAYVGNGTTQITAGITLSADFDGVTGLNNVRVVASSGNGFATATNVSLVITTGTVDSVSVVGEEIGSFSIENRPVNTDRFATQAITAAAPVTIPASIASPTNITAGTITTVTTVTNLTNAPTAGDFTATMKASTLARVTLVDTATVTTTATNLTNAPTNGDLTATMKTSVTTAATAATPIAASVSGNVVGSVGSVVGAVGSVTGNVGGNVTGSVGSVVGAVGSVTGLTAANLDATISSRASAASLAALNNLAAGAAMTLTTGERDAIAAALLDLANAIETGLTLRNAMRLTAAASAGKVSGMGTTTVVIRNAVADSKNRVTATCSAVGDRSSVTVDLT